MIRVITNSTPTQIALSVFRVAFFADADNIEKLRNVIGTFYETKMIPPFSSSNEMIVMKQLIKQSRSMLRAYPRTQKGDEDILLNEDLTTNHRNALILTMEEKKNLNNLISWAERVLDLLMMKRSEAIRLLQTHKVNSLYLTDVLLPLLEREEREN